MASRKELLRSLWEEIINPYMQEHWIDNAIRGSEKNPNAPFADTAAVLQRLLAAGASRRDLSLIARRAAYESVFGTVYALDDPGLDDPEDAAMLHESLLSADPSGMEGRPGSAPQNKR